MSMGDLWEHYCEEEHCQMAVGKGEPCNWCGKEETKEEDYVVDTYNRIH